jgi:hypothetical protein
MPGIAASGTVTTTSRSTAMSRGVFEIVRATLAGCSSLVTRPRNRPPFCPAARRGTDLWKADAHQAQSPIEGRAEPISHIDMETIESLQIELEKYPGSSFRRTVVLPAASLPASSSCDRRRYRGFSRHLRRISQVAGDRGVATRNRPLTTLPRAAAVDRRAALA